MRDDSAEASRQVGTCAAYRKRIMEEEEGKKITPEAPGSQRPAKADQWNKKTIVTLSDSVEIPGMVLDPGTYIFQLADSQSNRHFVQI